MTKKLLIYLADLTHTGPVISSEVFPFACGLIGAYLLSRMPDDVSVELFKFPEDLSAALEKRTPDIMGFSNYSWNMNLSYDFASRVKRHSPKTVVLFGGPNYDLNPDEVKTFWQRYPAIDFYVVQEGEEAAVSLVTQLKVHGLNVQALKASGVELPSCHYLFEGRIVENASLPRIGTLDNHPSPYLMGLMDKFFEHNLFPLTHTTRGCPFRCAYCMEGIPYYNKVLHCSGFAEELEYIAKRVRNVAALYLSDANFGMYPQDIEKARVIARMQEKYGYPKHVFVATGKNQRAQVLEINKIIHGSMFISTAIQSTDAQVLKNIERDNISLEGLTEIAQRTREAGANTYTELILALPGDSKASHQKSLRDAVNSRQGVVRMYQLIMLPQTKLYSPENIMKFGLRTKFRVMPRSYGRYKVFGEEFTSVEAEKICVGNAVMSFDDYLECREMNMTVEILHNGSPFREIWILCDQLGIPWFDVLMEFHRRRRENGPELASLYDDFRQSNIDGYWDEWDDLQREVKGSFGTYQDNTSGTNEMSKAKAVAFFRVQDKVQELIHAAFRFLLEERGFWSTDMEAFLDELKRFTALRKKDVFNDTEAFEEDFHYPLQQCLSGEKELRLPLARSRQPLRYRFLIDQKQKEIFRPYVQMYGTSTIDGLGRILMRSRMDDLCRHVSVVSG